MTALATPPVTGRPASSSPHLLRWLLRLHRPALLAWTVFVLVLAGLLLWVGGPLTDGAVEGWRQYNACESGGCVYDPSAVGRYKDWYTYTTLAVLAAPFLVAAWAGATLTSRELEHGTAQLAWTQSVSPARWLAAKLAVPAVLVAVGSGLLVGLHHWAWSTGQGRIDSAKDWFDIGTYAANGPATAAMALAGLVIGALFGLLKRNSLASLVGSLFATVFLWSVMALATPYLWPTVTKVSSLKNTVPAKLRHRRRPGPAHRHRRPPHQPALREHRLGAVPDPLHQARRRRLLQRLPPPIPLLAPPVDRDRDHPRRHRAPGPGRVPTPRAPDRSVGART